MASRQYLNDVVISPRFGGDLDVRFIQLSATTVIPRPFIISGHPADVPPRTRRRIRSPSVNVIIHHDVELSRHRRQVKLEYFGMPTQHKVLRCMVCVSRQFHLRSRIHQPIHPRLYIVYLNHFRSILTTAPATLFVNSSTAASKAGVYISCLGLL